MRTKFLLAGLVMLAALPARAAEYAVRYVDGKAIVDISGKIEQDEDVRFLQWVKTNKIPKPAVVTFNSPGGHPLGGIHLGDAMRTNGLTTAVRANEECSSACFFAWAGGVKRLTGVNAKVGVHSVYEMDETQKPVILRETGGTKAGTLEIARQLSEWGVSDRVVMEMITTKGSDKKIYFLDGDDLASMNVKVIN